MLVDALATLLQSCGFVQEPASHAAGRKSFDGVKVSTQQSSQQASIDPRLQPWRAGHHCCHGGTCAHLSSRLTSCPSALTIQRMAFQPC